MRSTPLFTLATIGGLCRADHERCAHDVTGRAGDRRRTQQQRHRANRYRTAGCARCLSLTIMAIESSWAWAATSST